MSDRRRFSRRTFIGMGMFATLAPTLINFTAASSAAAQGSGGQNMGMGSGKPIRLSQIEEATVADLQAGMAAGTFNSVDLVTTYIARIHEFDQNGPKVNSVLQLNPDAVAIAAALDKERQTKGPRGPLHGIPILLKDNVDTADKMDTTAGSLALLTSKPSSDAPIAAQLRAAGAVILGKTTLSEWANYRSTHSSSGWSGRGGQCNNPYYIDRNPSGSSSGSAAAVSSNFTAVSIGTETDGSIISPANNSGVVGIKPTVGLTSRTGVIPISHNQDTVGPHGRTVADAAAVLGAITAQDPKDPFTMAAGRVAYTDYTQFLNPNALSGARIGVARQGVTGYSEKTDALFEQALQALRDAGAILTDPADIPNIDAIQAGDNENIVLSYDFKHDINAYLATRKDPNIHTLQDLIDFNNAHRDQELQWFGQEIFIASQARGDLTDPTYVNALNQDHAYAAAFDSFLSQFDAVVAPTGSPAWKTDLVDGDHFLGASTSPAAISGFPLINVPMGLSYGLPVGITFMGRAWSEPKLIALAYSFEQHTKARQVPQFKLSSM